MKVLLRTTYANSSGVKFPGATLDVSDKEAEQLVDGGFAELVDEPAPRRRETASRRSAPENTSQPAPDQHD